MTGSSFHRRGPATPNAACIQVLILRMAPQAGADRLTAGCAPGGSHALYLSSRGQVNLTLEDQECTLNLILWHMGSQCSPLSM